VCKELRASVPDYVRGNLCRFVRRGEVRSGDGSRIEEGIRGRKGPLPIKKISLGKKGGGNWDQAFTRRCCSWAYLVCGGPGRQVRRKRSTRKESRKRLKKSPTDIKRRLMSRSYRFSFLNGNKKGVEGWGGKTGTKNGGTSRGKRNPWDQKKTPEKGGGSGSPPTSRKN